ncbi:MAG: DinB family protein [Nitrolancea sp.]
MPRTSIAVEEIVTMLAAAPERIAAVTKGLTEEQLHTPPSDGEWSINDILAHMRACADQWGDSIVTIVNEDHPTIRAINPRSWIKRTDYRELQFGESFRAYTDQRAELMNDLQSLSADDWNRSATVTGAGAPLERTVHGYAQRLARHERPHLKQIEQTARVVRG